MAATAEYKCQCCKQPFIARTADRKRGWARFCSKTCKAVKQEARTGQYAAYRNREDLRSEDSGLSADQRRAKKWDEEMNEDWGHPMAAGYEGHGQW